MRASTASLGTPVEVDARHGRLGAGEDDVLGLLDVDGRGAQLVEDVRQHAGLVAVAHDEHVRGRRPRGEVHEVRHLPCRLKVRDDAHGLGGDGLLRLLGGRADVVRAVDVRQVEQRVAVLAVPADGSSRKTSRATRRPWSRTAASSAA